MLHLITQPIDETVQKEISEDLAGYVKVVIDVERSMMTAGGKRHVEGEQLLLHNGSKQENLWGGGIDMETKEIDFDSMINIRPNQANPSREVLSQDIRQKMEDIIRKFFKLV